MKWTKEKLKEEALKYETRGEFAKNSRGAYGAATRLCCLEEICQHMSVLHTSWTRELVIIEARKYKTKSEFRNDSLAYRAAIRIGCLDEACQHMTALLINWTKNLILIESSKYRTRGEFKGGSGSAYSAATRLGCLEEACQHMVAVFTNWTKDLALKEARKYGTRTEFQEESVGAYKATIRLGCLEEACEHMSQAAGTSKSEKTLFSIVQSYFPSSKKIRKTGIYIELKPYIHGFDIDIFVPEINRGIEFDGKYWHSYEGLKKARPLWSDEDILAYHKIKDDYFRSQGIEILHIKEEEWIKDSEGCIKRCLKFLRGEN